MSHQSPSVESLRVDPQRLFSTLMEIGRIGATGDGGSRRLALTPEDGEARDLFCAWAREAGCAIAVDRIGNIFARRAGRDPGAAPVMMGSHLDTVPTGGKFDGIFGVLAGLEVVRTLNDAGIATQAPLEVVVWTNEEGSRFSPFTMGSSVYVGDMRLEGVLERRELSRPVDGATVGEALIAIGYDGNDRRETVLPALYLEAHVEQGPILADEGYQLGVVTGTFYARYFVATVTGEPSHVGPTPMDRRHDALVCASRLVVEIDRIGRAHGPDARSNAPHLDLFPNVRGVVPSVVSVSCDFRHSDPAAVETMVAEFRAVADRIAAEQGCGIDIEQYFEFGPIAFDPEVCRTLRENAARLGLSQRDMLTVAGHDAVVMSAHAPTGLFFAPSRHGGVSHSPAEYSAPEDLAPVADVLLQTALAAARAV